MTLHDLLHRHVLWTLARDGRGTAEVMTCALRFWPRCRAWYRPAPDALWEEVGDLNAWQLRLADQEALTCEDF